MGKASLNKGSIYLAMSKSPVVKKKVMTAARVKLKEDLNGFIQEFENHPVSRELNAGPDQESSLSGAISGRGNLYSFIGFERGRNPVKEVVNILRNSIKLSNYYQAKNTKNGFQVEVGVNLPSKEELKGKTPYEWDKSASWLYGIESTISGIGRYLFGIFDNPPSRSGGGVQLSHRIKNQVFYVPQKYFSDLYNRFKNRLIGK